MVAEHGVAGYQSGCRCEQCCAAQISRVRQLAAAELQRWQEIERTSGMGTRRHGTERPHPAGSRAYKTWTASELRLALDQSLDNRQVAELTKRSVTAVRQMRQKIARYL